MKALTRVSLILSGVTVILGYAMLVTNIISLAKSRKVSRIVE